DLNDHMIKEIMDALQNNTSVVITDRENPYSEAPPSIDLKCLPLREEELKVKPKSETSKYVKSTSPTENFSEFYLLVVSNSKCCDNSETFFIS
ncbi:hypothetical protein PJP07_30350, partial [Mycobacterium kansasii]